MGVGLGSNFAASYAGEDAFALGEGSWDREINELGPLFGLGFLALRVSLALAVVIMAYRALRRNVLLPFYLLPTTALAILVSNLDQPTSQGFLTVLVSMLYIAAVKGDPSAEL
jgi:hypothetical protein